MKKGIEKEISANAQAHKLKSGHAFYRVSRESLEGIGYQFFCDIFGEQWFWSLAAWPAVYVEKSCRAKETNFRNITQQLPMSDQPSEGRRPFGV